MKWTQDQDDKLTAMKMQGASSADIAKELSRTPNQCNVRWHTLRHDEQIRKDAQAEENPIQMDPPADPVPEVVVAAAADKLQQLQHQYEQYHQLADVLYDDIVTLQAFVDAHAAD